MADRVSDKYAFALCAVIGMCALGAVLRVAHAAQTEPREPTMKGVAIDPRRVPDADRPSDAVLLRSDLSDDRATPLSDGLQQEYLARYGPNDELSAYPADTFAPPHGAGVLVTIDGIVVAGGGIRILEPGVCEIKRMWTHPLHRRQGLARMVLTWLEDEALAMGCSRVRLETGDRQPEAIALYRALGYNAIGGYGRYRESADSLSFERRLS